MFKRWLSVGLSDKHNVENDFLYSNSKKWNWRLMNKQYICIKKNGRTSWLTACENNFFYYKDIPQFLSIHIFSFTESTKHYLLKSFFYH